jgi:hypothetical protein
MRISKILIFVVNLLFAGKSVGQRTNDLITERIIYTVNFSDSSFSENPFYNLLEKSKKDKLINTLCDLVFEGQIPANSYWGEIGYLPSTFNTLRKQFVDMYFFRNDTIKYDPEKAPYKTNWTGGHRDNYVYRYLINSLSFNEEWYFNSKSNTFKKKVKGVFLTQDEYTHNKGMKTSYYLPLNDSVKNQYKTASIITETIIYDVPITHFNQEQCDDNNWWHNYLEASKREKLLNTLTYKALNDTVHNINVFSPNYPFDSLMERGKYSNQGLGKIYYGRSDWYSGDPLMFGMTPLKIQACCTELSDWTTVRKIRFHEKWYFNIENLNFEKKVIGIGLIVNSYADNGDIIGEKCLVYYRLNN